MAAKDTLIAGIKTLSAEMSQATDKEQADQQYAEKLADLIDTHAKSLIAELTGAAITQLGLVAGPYPVVAPVPTAFANLSIKDYPV